jgi:DNA-binding NarL/FixJ family response regulator
MRRSILIVDDDERFRGITRRLLETEGFDVVGEAQDGEAALAAARELEPDVVLLDIHLPDIDGLEVAERLAATNGQAVVLTSTRDESDFGPALHSSGARGFVPKSELSAERIASLCR